MSVYKIYCKNPAITDCYVGSSKNVINRIKQHKNNKHNKTKLYTFIRENEGMDNWDFIILEDKIDYNILHDREKYWINHLNTTLNIQWKNTNLEEEIFKCEYCNIILSSSASLNTHKKSNKKCLSTRIQDDNNIVIKKEFTCSECGFITNLKHHILSHKCRPEYIKIYKKYLDTEKENKLNIEKLNIIEKENIEKLNIIEKLNKKKIQKVEKENKIYLEKIEKLKNKNRLLKSELTEKLHKQFEKHETQLFTLASSNL